ncbi:putative F-box protein At5g66830 [Telopea speciosissima]|uniref:putative F-box protein At5g66830 n=1 Tax=Telopea speciosissima TaxID=54955 RepID=UPI001CC77E9A|nr:putative F-box protein At5g66830 [Telopea speciosissima]
MEKGRRFSEGCTSGSSASAPIVLALSDLDLKKEGEENKEEVERKETDKWSWGLPKEILRMILERLAFPDNLRFAAVCVPWKRVTMERNQMRKYPWVMFSYTHQTKVLSFFSLSESRVYHVNIPWIEARQCLGSCQGWILASNPSPRDCFLFNPFSREAPIELPYLDIWAGKSTYCWHSQNFFHKVILSSSPTDPDCLVLAIMDSCGLAYCKLGDSKWVVFKDIEEDDFGEDVVFYNGQVYALSENDHQLMVLDMEDPVLSGDEDFDLFPSPDEAFALYPRKEDINVCPFMEIVDQEPLFEDASFYQNYLVQSQGNLLLVSRIYRHATGSLDDRDFFTRCECGRKMFPRRHLQTIRFLVYKLVECNPESSDDSNFRYNWVKQSRLGDDQVLFLGRGLCQSLSTVDCPGLKGNTIYFTDDGKLVLNPPQQRDMGIYHLDDSQIEPLLPFDSSQFNVLPFWIIPST